MRSRSASPPSIDAATAAEIERWRQDAQAEGTEAADADPPHGLSSALYRGIVDGCADAIVVIDADQSIRYVNRAAETMFKRPRDAFIGQPIGLLIAPRFNKYHGLCVEASRRRGDTAQDRASLRPISVSAVRETGEEFPVEISMVPMDDRQGLFMAAVVRDVTEQRLLEEELKRLALTDPMTGALNRRAFSSRLVEEIERSLRHGHALALAIVEVDHFTTVNDVFGRGVGEVALKHVVQLMCGEIRLTDALGRWERCSFILLMPHTDVDQACVVCERLRYEIARSPLAGLSDRGAVPLTVSIGVVEFEAVGDSVGELVQRADRALGAATASGRNQVVAIPNLPRGTLLA